MSGTLRAIAWGGTACGILDAAATSLQLGLKGVKPLRVWQGVASGALGVAAFRQGWRSGGFGLILHFIIAFAAAAIFVAASYQVPFLVRAYLVSGPVYGIVVYLVMNAIVVPLSSKPKRPNSTADVLIQLTIHILFVGLPISLAASRFGFFE
jgi:hypothetical protein